MGAVDYANDAVRRFVVRRYAFDPERRERRHIVVAVVDRRREFHRLIDRLSDELQRRRAAGEDVDPREHISGHVLEPGDLARAANGHLVRRAVEHGVSLDRLQGLDLPGSIALLQPGRQR